jgi:hypothetical protein
VQLAEVEAELLQQPQRARRETVAAGLVARERRLVHHQHIEATVARADRSRRPRRPGADNDEIEPFTCAHVGPDGSAVSS